MERSVIKIVLVDDHPLFRAGVRTILDGNKQISIVAEATNGLEAIDKIIEFRPDVVIMDISMPGMDGIAATKKIVADFPESRVIAMSMYTTKRYVNEMLDAGAAGYLVKDSAPEEIISAILKVAEGNMYLSPTITSVALGRDEKDESPEASPILQTKLHKPPITDDFILRTDIINFLESNFQKPLSLVAAPAGYGKSVTISQWLDQTHAQHAWISLDAEHNDLRLFLIYLLTALDKLFPGSVKHTRTFLDAVELPPLNKVIYTLVNELDKISNDFILVLDDYHHITNDSIHQLIEELLQFPPEHMHLSILTRRDPPLNLNRLRSHDRISEIRMKKLAFNEAEIIELIQKLHQVTLDSETAKSVHKKTEGWIVGLRLASLAIEDLTEAGNFLNNLEGDIYTVSEFLLEEVLMKQPPEIQELLSITSLFGRFSGQLIRDICINETKYGKKETDSKAFIQWLINSNLFLIPLDVENKWFRYHHLFQELLNQQLKRHTDPEKINRIHLKASEWFIKQDMIKEGIFHAMAAGEIMRAAEIVEKHRHKEINNDRWYVVEQWMKMLPEEIKQKRPGLLLAQVIPLFEQFRLMEMSAILSKVESMLPEQKIDPALMGEVIFYRGFLALYLKGEGEAAIKLFEEAKRLVPLSHEMFRGEIELYLGLARQLLGEKVKAVQSLEEKIQLLNPSDHIILSRLTSGLSFIHIFSADLYRARQAIQRMVLAGEQARNAYVEAYAQYLSGMVALHSFQLEEALQYFNSALKRKDIINVRLALDLMTGLTLTHQFIDQPGRAFDQVKELIKFAEDTGFHEHMDVAHSCQARLMILQGDFVTANEWLQSPPPPLNVPSLFFWIENPLITHIRVKIERALNGDLESALETLEILQPQVEKLHNDCQLIEILVLKTMTLEKLNRREEALQSLESSLTLVSPNIWIRPYIESGPGMQELLNALYKKNPALDHIKNLLESFITEKEQLQSELEKKMPIIAVPQQLIVPIREAEMLTVREHEIINLLASGLRNKEIAAKLFITENTIKKHLSNTYDKLNVKNRIGLINKAKEIGLID